MCVIVQVIKKKGKDQTCATEPACLQLYLIRKCQSWMSCSLSSHTFLSLLQTVSEVLPNPVTCSTVAPATLHLLEPINAAFFSSKATPWSVNIIYFRFRIDSKVQKEIYYFPIRQDSRLSRACENIKLLRWFEGLLQLLYLNHTYSQTEDNNIFQWPEHNLQNVFLSFVHHNSY